ncbi:hypothetical protein TRFO_38012 [Tritrichomonas foetus]|uniref:Uncharacterized protein n=1 Tax=Tritrichomonas foetus TaxID=1144522 RepID=A0A1J4JEG4_9EUKA|nr:hypothetical protein TRFO_38012 [Tritrichomonas foetus]|eukprot:OHS95829.1 hypothetical protein TRFO_38012 [Tritrichomonas foetus]
MDLSYKNLEERSYSLISYHELVNKIKRELIGKRTFFQKNHSVNDMIQSLILYWREQNLSEFYPSLVFLSEELLLVEQNEMDLCLLNEIISIIFTILVAPFNEEATNQYHRYLIDACLATIINLLRFPEGYKVVSNDIYDLCCSVFSTYSNYNETEENSLASIYIENSLRIIRNLTALPETYQIIADKIFLNCIGNFLVNPYIHDKYKKQSLVILYNIMKNSDILDSSFPIEQLLQLLRVLVGCTNSKNIYWLLHIILLLTLNDITAYKVMEIEEFQLFINNCLSRENITSQKITNEEKIYKIQMLALNIISYILNVENYDFDVNVTLLVNLASNRSSSDLILAALRTIQNYADCPEHVDTLIENHILFVINEYLEFGNYKLKIPCLNIHSNLLVFAPVSKLNELFECKSITIALEAINDSDDINLIKNYLHGLLNLVEHIENHNLAFPHHHVFHVSNGIEILESLKIKFDDNDERMTEYINSLLSIYQMKEDIY